MNRDTVIPAGYKHSPLGPIPEDWEVVYAEDICHISTGDKNTQDKAENGLFPFYVRSEKVEKINTYTFDGESVLTAGDGVGVGKVFHYSRGKIGVHQRVYIISDFKCNGKFFYYYFSHAFYGRVKRLSAKNSVDSVRYEMIAQMPFPVPPLPEQWKITEVLNTWDKAIELQTVLIAKLNLRKKGLMQQLLTGKKRLKGFSEPIAFRSIKGMVTEVSERHGTKKTIPVLSVTNSRGFITQLEQFDKEVASEDNSNYKIVKKGQFAYNPSRINVGSVDLLRNFECGILSPMYVVFETNAAILLPEYLLQQLKTHWFIGHIPNYVQGSVRDSLSFDGLCAMKFFIPSTKEQNAIVKILNAADQEIEKEQQKLEALKQQKKGLMQQLLTGKKRVVI